MNLKKIKAMIILLIFSLLFLFGCEEVTGNEATSEIPTTPEISVNIPSIVNTFKSYNGSITVKRTDIWQTNSKVEATFNPSSSYNILSSSTANNDIKANTLGTENTGNVIVLYFPAENAVSSANYDKSPAKNILSSRTYSQYVNISGSSNIVDQRGESVSKAYRYYDDDEITYSIDYFPTLVGIFNFKTTATGINREANLTSPETENSFNSIVYPSELDLDMAISLNDWEDGKGYKITFTFTADSTKDYCYLKVYKDNNRDKVSDDNVIVYGNTSITSSSISFYVKEAGTYYFEYNGTDIYGQITDKIINHFSTKNLYPVPIINIPSGTFYTGDAIAFNFSSSYDVDGSITNYRIDFNDNTIIDSSITNINHTYNRAGSYKVNLKVTDNLGYVKDTSVELVLIDKDKITAVINSLEENYAKNSIIKLNASSSTPTTNATITDYKWIIYDSEENILTTNLNALWTYKATHVGTIIVSLMVTDSDGNTDISRKTFTITNKTPIAVLNEFAEKYYTGDDITFDFSNSQDEDGTIVRYWIDFGNGNTKNCETTKTTTYKYNVAGIYKVKLVITDNNGASASVSKDITLIDKDKISAVINNLEENYDKGVIIKLDANSSTPTTNATITNYKWVISKKDGGEITNNTNAIFNYTTSTAGEIIITLTITDSDNKTAIASKTINVANKLPIASLNEFTGNYYTGDEIVFDFSKSHDEDGSIIKYWIDFGDGSTKDCGNTNNTKHIYQRTGEYKLTLIVTDNDSSRATITSEIELKERQVITANYTISENYEDKTLYTLNAGDVITLDGSSSIPSQDGIITNYKWEVKWKDVWYTIASGSDKKTYNHILNWIGVGIIKLTIKDDKGGETSIESNTLVVKNRPPTAKLEADVVSGYAPLNVIYNYNNSDDEDCKIKGLDDNYLDELTFRFSDSPNGGWQTGNYFSNTKYNLTWTVSGNTPFYLDVTDKYGANVKDTLYINVLDKGSLKAIISPISKTTGYKVGDIITLDGSSSTAAVDKSIASYKWFIEDKLIGEGAKLNYSVNFIGSKNIKLVIADNSGSTSEISTSLLTSSSSAPNIVNLSTDKVNGYAPYSFTITPEITDIDVITGYDGQALDELKYYFALDNKSLYALNSTSSKSYTLEETGTHTIYLKVRDNYYNVKEDSIKINVLDLAGDFEIYLSDRATLANENNITIGDNIALTPFSDQANAITSVTWFLSTEIKSSYNINDISDPNSKLLKIFDLSSTESKTTNGDLASYLWNTSKLNINSTDVANTFTGLGQIVCVMWGGTNVITWKNITINAVNQKPIASAKITQNEVVKTSLTISSTSEVTLDASGSSDDKAVVSYQWHITKPSGATEVIPTIKNKYPYEINSIGTYTFYVVVYDEKELTATSQQCSLNVGYNLNLNLLSGELNKSLNDTSENVVVDAKGSYYESGCQYKITFNGTSQQFTDLTKQFTFTITRNMVLNSGYYFSDSIVLSLINPSGNIIASTKLTFSRLLQSMSIYNRNSEDFGVDAHISYSFNNNSVPINSLFLNHNGYYSYLPNTSYSYLNGFYITFPAMNHEAVWLTIHFPAITINGITYSGNDITGVVALELRTNTIYSDGLKSY